MTLLSRRRVLSGGLVGFGSLALAGCNRLSNSGSEKGVLDSAEALTQRA